MLFSVEYSMRCFSPQQARQRPAACCIFLVLCTDSTAFLEEKQPEWRFKGGYAVNSDLLSWFYNHFNKFCCRICALFCRIQHALFFTAASAGAAGRYNHGFIIPQTQQSAVVQWTLPLGNAANMIDGFIIPYLRTLKKCWKTVSCSSWHGLWNPQFLFT